MIFGEVFDLVIMKYDLRKSSDRNGKKCINNIIIPGLMYVAHRVIMEYNYSIASYTRSRTRIPARKGPNYDELDVIIFFQK